MGVWSNHLHPVLFSSYNDWYDNYISHTGLEPLEEEKECAQEMFRNRDEYARDHFWKGVQKNVDIINSSDGTGA